MEFAGLPTAYRKLLVQLDPRSLRGSRDQRCLREPLGTVALLVQAVSTVFPVRSVRAVTVVRTCGDTAAFGARGSVE